MHNDFNRFVLSLDFEINQFNVGRYYERAYIVLLNYRDWITNNLANYDYIVSKVQFEIIIDHLLLNEFNGQQRQEYANLKKVASEDYSIDLISIYTLYLVLKVRTRQIGNSDLSVVEIQEKLAKIFYPIDFDEKTKQEIIIHRELPEINKNENSSKMVLPISLLILSVSLSKIFSSSIFVFVIQIFIFLVVGLLLGGLIKKQKSVKDIDELKTWDYIVNSVIKDEVQTFKYCVDTNSRNLNKLN